MESLQGVFEDSKCFFVDLPSRTIWLFFALWSSLGRAALGINTPLLVKVTKWYFSHEPTRIPMAILVSVTPWLAFHMLRQPRSVQVQNDFLYKAKTAATVAIAIFQFQIYLSKASHSPRELLGVLEAFSLAILLPLEHTHRPRPYTLLGLYLTLTTGLQILFKWSSLAYVAPDEGLLQSSHEILTRVLVVILHEQSKWKVLTMEAKAAIGQEDASGIWSRTFSIQMYPVLWNGLSRDLLSRDAGYTSPALLTQYSMLKFDRLWNKYRILSHGLLKSCLLVCKQELLRAGIAQLIHVVLSFGSSLYFASVVTVLEQRRIAHPSNQTSPTTFDMIAGAVVLFGAVEFFGQLALREIDRAKTTARGVLVASVLQKLPLLSEELLLQSSELSLLTSTITSAVNSIDAIQVFGIGVFRLCLSARLLWHDLGYKVFLWIIALTVSSILCYRYTDDSEDSKRHVQACNAKTNATNTLLRNLHSLRMTGRLDIFGEQIHHLHRMEMDAFITVRFNWAKQMTIVFIIHCSVVFVAFYTKYLPAACGSYAPLLKCLHILLSVEMTASRIVVMGRRIGPTLATFSSIGEFLNLPINPVIPPLEGSISETKDDPPNAVEFHRANIAIAAGGTPVLRNIELNAPARCVTLVVGEAGTGKSTLLKTILGRTEVQSGSVYAVDTVIAYCAQNTWLHSRSIRDNIVGTGIFNQAWYEKVKAKCFISEDIRRLPNADDFIVSHEKTLLGGALRQRLALARTVYLRAHLTLLDDFLSAQDEQMAADLVKSLFGRRKGILRKRSVIVAASDPAPLIDAAHAIFKFNRQGFVLETTKNTVMQNFEKSTGLIHPTDQARQEHAELLSVDAKARSLLQDIQQIKPTPRNYETATLASCFPKVGWEMNLVATGLNLIGVVAENISVLYLATWISRAPVVSHPLAFYAVAVVYAFAAPTSKGLLISNCYKYLSIEMHSQLLDTVLKMPVYAWTSDTLDTIQSLFNDSLSAAVTTVFPEVLYVAIYFWFTAGLIVGLSILFSPWFLLILPLTATIVFQLQKATVHATRQLKHFDYESTQALKFHYVETLSGAPHIYAQGWRANYMSWSRPHINSVQRTFYLGLCIDRWRESVLSFHAIIVAVFIVIISLSTNITPAATTFICFNYPNFVQMLKMIVPRYVRLRDSLVAVQRVRTFIERAPQEPEERNMTVPPDGWPSKGIVKFENASIWLDPSAPAPVLSNISYTLKRQAKTGLFGRPGSGKSTLLYALLNMVKYTGSIKIDEIEVRTVSQEVLRQKIAILPERPALIIGTIAQNLLPIELHDEEDPKLANVLENILSSLGLLALVRERGGLDAEIADFKFSPDQLQRFALAQTLTSYYYYRQKLMIEDGVCNSVDATTLKYLRRVIKDIFGQGSMIVTGQNLSVVKGANKIGLVEDGQVWFEP